jgi:exopolysaccharide biosynthesis protein
MNNTKGVFQNYCCKKNTLDHTIKRRCVTINGTYFDTEGVYPNDDNKYILAGYKQLFKSVTVNNNEIKLNQDLLPNTVNSFISGPPLVVNGNPFIIDLFAKHHNGTYIFTCKKNSEEDEYKDCDEISPGELYHIGNPNPRSIIANKGNKTYFICIEGRTKKYKGATFEQMTDFLVNYLQVNDAINLDGGASISLMWNINGQVYSPLNYLHRKTLSNVISFNY